MGRRSRGARRGGQPDLWPSDWTPALLSSVTGWWRADQGITLVGSKVSSWVDIEGGVALTQGTDAVRPTYNASDADFNNHASMTFPAGGYISGGTAGTLVPGTGGFFAAVRTYSQDALDNVEVQIYNYALAVSDFSYNFGAPVGNGSKAYAYEWDGAAKSVQTASGLTAGTPYAMFWSRNATSVRGRVDNGTWASTSCGTGNRNGVLYIDSEFVGKYAEIITGTGALSDADAYRLWRYLQLRYAL